MERGILVQADVAELLRQFELFEVYVDDAREKIYAAEQKRMTGQLSNPTYLVLDSHNLLEVDRATFTTSAEEFKGFLRRGLQNQPAFRSLVRFEGLEPSIRGEKVTLLEAMGPLEFTRGADVVGAGGGAGRRAYREVFTVRQQFRVPAGVAPGAYAITAQLVTSVYGDDLAYRETLGRGARLPFEVVAP